MTPQKQALKTSTSGSAGEPELEAPLRILSSTAWDQVQAMLHQRADMVPNAPGQGLGLQFLQERVNDEEEPAADGRDDEEEPETTESAASAAAAATGTPSSRHASTDHQAPTSTARSASARSWPRVGCLPLTLLPPAERRRMTRHKVDQDTAQANRALAEGMVHFGDSILTAVTRFQTGGVAAGAASSPAGAAAAVEDVSPERDARHAEASVILDMVLEMITTRRKCLNDDHEHVNSCEFKPEAWAEVLELAEKVATNPDGNKMVMKAIMRSGCVAACDGPVLVEYLTNFSAMLRSK